MRHDTLRRSEDPLPGQLLVQAIMSQEQSRFLITDLSLSLRFFAQGYLASIDIERVRGRLTPSAFIFFSRFSRFSRLRFSFSAFFAAFSAVARDASKDRVRGR